MEKYHYILTKKITFKKIEIEAENEQEAQEIIHNIFSDQELEKELEIDQIEPSKKLL